MYFYFVTSLRNSTAVYNGKKPFKIPVSASWSRWPPKSDQLLVTHPVPPKIFVEIHRQFLSRVSQHTIHTECELFYQFRLSNAGTVSKLMHISSIFDILVGYRRPGLHWSKNLKLWITPQTEINWVQMLDSLNEGFGCAKTLSQHLGL